MTHITLYISILIQLGVVVGLIYPTEPISTTVWTAGQAARIQWIEDGRKPLISSVGDVKIELWASNTTFISTLARNIDPMSLSTTVFIPPFVPANHHAYTLRFKSSVVADIIYSADFTILASALDQARVSATKYRPGTSTGSMTSSAPSVYATGPGGRPLGIGAPPVISRITGSQYLYPSMAPTPPIAPPASGLFQPPTVDEGPTVDAVNERNGASASSGTRLSATTSRPNRGRTLDRLFFVATYVVWPALIGLSLAA